MTLQRVRPNIEDWATNRIYEEVPEIKDLEAYVDRLKGEEVREFERLVGKSLYPAISAAFALGVEAALNPALLLFEQEDASSPG